jgi:phosphopantetheinyl transferase (holo-ACP synthase)
MTYVERTRTLAGDWAVKEATARISVCFIHPVLQNPDQQINAWQPVRSSS